MPASRPKAVTDATFPFAVLRAATPRHRVQGLPTLVLFDRGEERARAAGTARKEAILAGSAWPRPPLNRTRRTVTSSDSPTEERT
jgi:hypothetical protein